MSEAPRGLAAAGALAALLGGACTGAGFAPSDLPTAPIAVVHRTPEESERVAELLDRARERGRRGSENETRVRLEEVGEVLGLGRSRAQRQADYQGRLALVDPRSGEVRRLGFATRGERPLDWSHDRDRLLLMSQRRGTPQIYEYLFERRELRPVTHGPEPHVGGCYGPERRFALVGTTRGPDGGLGTRILVTGPNGADPRPATPGPHDTGPDWSPDGGVLVYETRDASGAPAVAALRMEGGAPAGRRVLARGRDPTFTPDGRWVVYSAERERGWRLWRMRPDGSGRQAVGASGQEQRWPAVSPDGRFVVYAVPEDTRHALWVRRLDGGGGERPLLTDGDGLRPHW